MEKEQGGCYEIKEEVIKEIYEFYSHLFTLEDFMGWESKLDGIQSSITDSMNS